MPVQPAAGSFRLVALRAFRFMLGTLPFFAVGALTAAGSGSYAPWYFYASAVLLFLEVAIIGCAAFLAIPKYRAERSLGYTTWPEKEEGRDVSEA